MSPLQNISFPGSEPLPQTTVGGKGHSLLRMAAAGLPVPPGAIVPTSFFAPWFETITDRPAWTQLLNADPSDWPPLCDRLKAHCHDLPLSPRQRDVLDALRSDLTARCGPDVRVAVRSSSPEEDLASASFAGGYETRLGVPLDDLEDAVRHCCASSLDARVLVYKTEHGFDDLTPRLAVVVQQQIASDVSGVGFSLNPVTNDYDEAVINASWGLGSSVVDGRVSPDHVVVDKVNRRIIESHTGTKSVSVTLDPAAGVREQSEDRPDQQALTPAQIQDVTALLCRVEALYGHPVDVEWTYADGRLYVLQARPITTYVPLHPSLQTAPGAPRRLYADFGLAKGAALNAPFSPLGQRTIQALGTHVAEWFLGDVDLDLDSRDSFLQMAPGRVYQNLSALLTIASPDRLAAGFEESDSRIAAILRTIDADRYRLPERPSWARWSVALRWLPHVARRVLQMLRSMLGVLLAPERAWTVYQRRVAAFETRLTDRVDNDLPLPAFVERYLKPSVMHFLEETGPAYGGSFLALQMLDRVAGTSAETQALTQHLKRGFRGEIVTDMGIALYRMAQRLDPVDVDDLSRLAERIKQRDLPDAFLQDWDRFLDRWGCRGPNEMDPGAPRPLAARAMSRGGAWAAARARRGGDGRARGRGAPAGGAGGAPRVTRGVRPAARSPM